ncbi:MAG: protein arginine kinase [Thermoguttaceae bacterium]|nr:protein arginine kinase [Thermoguttaceae bacterium]
MDIDKLFNRQGAWLQGTGPDSDIVISSRIRLARNVDGYPFVNRASEQNLVELLALVEDVFKRKFDESKVHYFSLQKMPQIDRYYLLERQLISRKLAESDIPRAVLIDRDEHFSIMVNEEDHLRLQAMTSGLDLQNVWNRISEIDDLLENELPVSFDEQRGYLTACPSNIGTGIRVSVMLHLPGLVESSELERAFRGLQKLSLAVRGIYGEGSSAMGEFFQISNQVTLGQSEEELIMQVAEVVPQIIEYERQARKHILETQKDSLLDRAFRAVGIMKTARTMSVEEAMEFLSRMRLGISLGLFTELPQEDNVSNGVPQLLNDLLLHIQPSHLCKIAGKELSGSDENVFRVAYIRKQLEDAF